MEIRKAVKSDVNNIMKIIKQAQEYFKNQGIDQWQNNYPNIDTINSDILNCADYGIPQKRKRLVLHGIRRDAFQLLKKSIPEILQRKDFLGCAQTGTGKTAAFAIPILQNLSQSIKKGKHIKALILTPTRELAIQIEENIKAYGKYLPLQHLVIFGGVKQGNQINVK